MKKGHIVLIVVISVCTALTIMSIAPIILFFGGTVLEVWYGYDGSKAEIEIDSYRLCESVNGDDIIIVKYWLKNDGKEPTALFYEGDFSVYQNGIGLNEYVDELPAECNYVTEDQYRNIKGGAAYYAEIAYKLEFPDCDVEVEVVDYDFFNKTKVKTFTIQ